VIEVMMREKDVVDIQWPESSLHELVRRGWTAIDHDLLALDFKNVR
jgi:hypothetical protein